MNNICLIDVKKCNKCSESKTLDNFTVRKDSKDGYRNQCKICEKEKNNNWYQRNKELVIINQRKWREKNPDKKRKTDKIWRENNKEKENQRLRIYHKNNPDTHKRWRKNNPQNIAIRGILRNSLLRLGQTKEGLTIDLLGYSALDLKLHIESLLTDGMSWDNYGEWHIDHIIGIINFDKNTHPSIVNALSNLRPIWATTREINGVIYEGNLNRAKYLN